MVEPERQVRGGPLVMVLHWVGFLLYCGVALVVTGVLSAVLLFAIEGVTSAEDATKLALDADALAQNPTVLGITTIVSIGAMAVGAVVGGMLLPTEDGHLGGFDPTPAGVQRTLAARGFHWAWALAAVFATALLGFLPGWGAEQLMELAPDDISSGMSAMAELVTDIERPGWIWMALAVAIGAPVFEEAIFRGYLWRAAEHGLPPAAVWIATSALFAAYHVNPIHVVSVFPIGLFFGWLRWMSGSIWPGMLAHFVNNTLALTLGIAVTADYQPGLALSSLATLAGLGVAGVAWRLARPRSEER